MAKLKKVAVASAVTEQVETPLVPEQITENTPIIEVPVQDSFSVDVQNKGGYDRPEPCSKVILKKGEITTICVDSQSKLNQVLKNIKQFNCLSGFEALVVVNKGGE